MDETTVIKLVIQGGFAGIAAVLLVLLFYALRHAFTRDNAQDQTEKVYLDLLSQTLKVAMDSQSEKFDELTARYTSALGTIVKQMQTNQEQALARLVETIKAAMEPISTARETKLDAIRTDLKTVPAETVRLLKQVLDPLFAEVGQKVDALPTENSTRRMIQAEIEVLQHQLAAQITEQIAPLLARLSDIGLAVAALSIIPQSDIEVARESSEPMIPAVPPIPADSGIQPAISDHIAQKGS